MTCRSRLLDLNTFFGNSMVADIKAQLCCDFVDWSTSTPNENNKRKGIAARTNTVSDQTARRRLEDLRAAINAYHAEYVLSVVPKITLPTKSGGRHRWLTRNEAVRLLGSALDVEAARGQHTIAARTLDHQAATTGGALHPDRSLQR